MILPVVVFSDFQDDDSLKKRYNIKEISIF